MNNNREKRKIRFKYNSSESENSNPFSKIAKSEKKYT